MGLGDFLGSNLAEVLMYSPRMSPLAKRRVAEWSQLERDGLGEDFAHTSFVVVDTEASGLDVRRDRLLSIGACIVEGEGVSLGRSFYRELRQQTVSATDNILLHGIGGKAQLEGEIHAEALSAFLEFAGKRTLVAFNAPFDHVFLAGAMRRYLGVRFAPRWIDLAELPKAMFPADAEVHKTLDDWLRRFGIDDVDRHNALGDAYGTAQLFVVMLKKARHEGYGNARGLLRAQKNYHWQRRR
jgi:DNA polymerase III subunit epsilon